MLGKLAVGEVAVWEVVTGEIVLGKLCWGNDLTLLAKIELSIVANTLPLIVLDLKN